MAWQSLDTGLIADNQYSIASALDASGMLNVFVAATDGGIRYRSQAPVIGWENRWNGVPDRSNSTNVAVTTNADGRLELFTIDYDFSTPALSRAVFGNWEAAPRGAWQPTMTAFGGGPAPSSLAASANADGRLEIFLVNEAGGGAVGHRWQTAPNNGWVPDWYSLGGSGFVHIAACRGPKGAIHLFAVKGADGSVHHRHQGPQGWSPAWTQLPGAVLPVTRVAAAAGIDGRLRVFGIGAADETVHSRIQSFGPTAPNGWTAWGSMGLGYAVEVAAGRNADGRWEVFALTRDQAYLYVALVHTWQQPNGSWSL